MKKDYSLGFIGIGNMGSALARAASERTDSLLLSCRTPEKAKKLAYTLGCDAATTFASRACPIMLSSA